MSADGITFRSAVYELVSRIPEGRVMTYGDIAAWCGQPNAARIIGGFAHFGPTDLPWHRVVSRRGDCAAGYYGGKAGHRIALEREGVAVRGLRIVDFTDRRWQPGL